MIAGLHYVLYLLAEVLRRILPGQTTGKTLGNGESSQSCDNSDRFINSMDNSSGKGKSLRVEPSMVNVTGFGQSIAVLTSGGDAQGEG